MKLRKTLVALGLGLATASTAFSGGLLGTRYVEVGAGSFLDDSLFSFGAGLNTNLHNNPDTFGVDLFVGLSTTEGNDTAGLSVATPFFWPLAREGQSVYVAPLLGYFRVRDSWFEEKSFTYGLQVGFELAVTEQTNVNLHAAYVNYDKFSVDGYDVGIELNHWVTDRINLGLGLSYDDLYDDTFASFSARFGF